jgi:hypothetical protein
MIWSYDDKYWGIKWYRENPGSPAPDTYCGPHWKIITPYPKTKEWEQLENYLLSIKPADRERLEVKTLVE